MPISDSAAKIQFQIAPLGSQVEIVKLVNSVYRGESGLKSWTTEAGYISGQRTDAKLIEEIIQDPQQLIIQASNANDQLVGCVHLTRDGSFAWLGMLTVDVNQQRTGLGGRLIKASEAEIVSRWGIHLMKMKVITIRTELLAWYHGKGYLPTGETMPFPPDNPRMGIPDRSDLEFFILQKTV